MAAGLATRLSHLRREFVACLPVRWRSRIDSRTAPFRLKIADDGSRATLWRDERQLRQVELDSLAMDTTLAALLRSREHPLVLELPPSWVLSRRLSLPAAARENLRQVIGFELDRITPFKAEQVHFDYLEVADGSSSDDPIVVDVVLVPRARVEPWLEALRQAGAPIDRMAPEEGQAELNLLPSELRARPDIKRMVWKALPGFALLLLLAAALLLPLWQAREVVIDLQQQERQLRRQSGKVLKLREALDTKVEELEQVRDHWQSVPPPLEVLQALTRLLPDDTYLQQMEIKGDRVVLRGLSGQASALIGLLEESPLFTEPHFLSPVTQQRGKELFHLETKVRLPFPYEALSSGKRHARAGGGGQGDG